MAPRPVQVLLCACAVGCIDYGVYRERIRDSFQQSARDAGVDILWVLDDSATMTEEQVLLVEEAGAFSALFGQLAIDFRLGLVTTDMEREDAGQLVAPYLSDETPALDEAFATLLSQPPDGSRDERGFPAAVAAADPATGSFGRAAADLEVVFLSDEDDHSGLTADQALRSLGDARPGAAVVANAVVGDAPDGCFSPRAAADPGLAYLQAQAQSDGQRESICDADYGALLERLALVVLDLEDRFQLSRVPSVPTIEVDVDGALIHPRDQDGWRYDPGDNSIVFDGYAVPPPGAGVTVRYYEWLGLEEPDTGV